MEPSPVNAYDTLCLEEPAKAKLVQAFKAEFMSEENREILIGAIAEKVIPKVLEDLPKILENGWAGSISPRDLNHCHVIIPFKCMEGNERVAEFVRMEAPEITLLYHSWELDRPKPKHRTILTTIDRNIITPLAGKELRVENKLFTVNPVNLGCWGAVELSFSKAAQDVVGQLAAGKHGEYYFRVSLAACDNPGSIA